MSSSVDEEMMDPETEHRKQSGAIEGAARAIEYALLDAHGYSIPQT